MIFNIKYLPRAANILETILKKENLNWEEGRQKTAYKKAALRKDLLCVKFVVKLLQETVGVPIDLFDSYLLHYPDGSYIPMHTDDALFGNKHIRANAILKQPISGGQLYLGDPGIIIPLEVEDVFIFEPNAVEHRVTVCDGDRYVLSIGTII